MVRDGSIPQQYDRTLHNYMTDHDRRMPIQACGVALLVLVGIATGRVGCALADQNAALAGDLSHAFTPAQMSHLINAASASSLTDQEVQSVGRLKSLLDVNDSVALALLRILNRPEISPEDTPQILAQSAAQYRAVIDRLSEITPEDAESRQMVTEAQTALNAGKFTDTETLLRKLEDHEVASSADPPGGSSQAASSATQHLISAAQAGTVLGEIALMKLRYGDATRYFQSAQQRLAALSQADAGAAATEPNDGVPTERPHAPPPVEKTTRIAQIDTGPPSAPLMLGVAAIGSGTASVHPAAVPGPGMPRSLPERAAGAASDNTVVSAEMLALLLQRGDALLAIGDVSSARLFYERAAAAGDGRGATGAGKTYDPKVLLAIGARGIQGDPVAAATWYRRAIELGDRSAAERLAQISPRGER
jgi:TPR repeat protein